MIIWLAALLLVVAAALFVAAPLADGLIKRDRATEDANFEQLEHRRALAVHGLRELEFDHQMGKLDDHDYGHLKAALEKRALAAMGALAGMRRRWQPPTNPPSSSTKGVSAQALRSPLGANLNFCPRCGTRAGAKHNFCITCGTSLQVSEAANQS